MAEFKLLDPITEIERFSTDKGSFVVYQVGIDGEQGRAAAIRHKRKASSPAPKAGEVLDATIVDGKDGKELKRVWSPTGGTPLGNGSAGGFRGKTPEEGNRIGRMNAQARALEYLRLKIDMGGAVTVQSWQDFQNVVDLFYRDARDAS